MNFDSLPDELIRKILTLNTQTVLQRSSYLNRHIFGFRLHHLLLPKCFGVNTTFDGTITKKDIQWHNKYIKEIYKKEKVKEYYDTTESFVVWCYEMIELINMKIGDYSFYDAIILNQLVHDGTQNTNIKHKDMKQISNWRIFGYKTGGLLISDKIIGKKCLSKDKAKYRKNYMKCLERITTRALVL